MESNRFRERWGNSEMFTICDPDHVDVRKGHLVNWSKSSRVGKCTAMQNNQEDHLFRKSQLLRFWTHQMNLHQKSPWALAVQVSNIMACKIIWSEPPWLLALGLFGVESLCTHPSSVEDMKSAIQEEISIISTEQLTDAVSCFAKRVGAVIESKGLYFEHLL